ncbi:MAG: hypothetical protein EPN39_17595 [Chitinophagaceae bacterium]|nr:MAG: hypothetical protein EPN39_17595 [Chitinophagaceae bacterium]
MRKLFYLIFCLAILVYSHIPSAKAQTVDSSNVAVILSRIRTILTQSFPNPDSILKWVQTMQPDGSWKGIDYQSTRFSAWPSIQHLNYVSNFANAYGNVNSPLYKDKRVEKALHLSLDYWLHHNFVNQNWWWDEIGVPESLSNILILMDGDFTHDELLRAINLMRGSYIQQTGQNRIWRSGIQLKIGLLTYGRNMETNLVTPPKDRIVNAIKILQSLVKVGGEEGIQPDWSFHQHGIQQQFGNYGMSFAASQVQWAWVLKNTPFHYDKSEIDILKNYLLKGLSLVVWNGRMDISACGRQLEPGSPETKGKQVIGILKLMSQLDPEYSSLYSNRIDYILGKNISQASPARNIYFWKSDLMIQRTLDYYISVRMHSKIVQGTESGAGENLLGAYLADGATYIYHTGKEYNNIFPVWNWRRIPGITSYVQGPVPESGWVGLPNESNFVGGVSDSSYGLAAMLFKRDGLTAYKSWFLSSEGMVCLGAGIQSDKNTDVSTTLNQSLVDGKIIVKTNRGRKAIDQAGQAMDGNDIDWVYHDNTGYIFLQKGAVHVSDDKQRGNWALVYNQGDPDPITKEVFNLWIDHGKAPINKSYAYMVLPGISLKLLSLIDHHPFVRVIQNDTLLQAIQYPGEKITQAVFYHPGRINLDKKITLHTNQPCLLLVKQINRGLTLTVSSPPENGEGLTLDANGFPVRKSNPHEGESKEGGVIVLSLNGHYTGEGCSYDSDSNQTKIIFQLPAGIYAGESISRTITLL